MKQTTIASSISTVLSIACLLTGLTAAGFWLPETADAAPKCPFVSIDLDQSAVLLKDSFRATMEITNLPDREALENLAVTLEIRNPQGEVATELFAIGDPELEGLSDVSGTGVIPTGQTGKAVWRITPSQDAAPDEPLLYDVGGEVSFMQSGVQFNVRLIPVEISVKPEAKLHLDYFHQHEVYGDDPFTEEKEPAEPFSVALMVENEGKGSAKEMRISSLEPHLVASKKGLRVDMKLLSAQVGTKEVNPSLLLDLGDIEPGGTAIACWSFVSSLRGDFVDFEASFEHIDDLGDKNVSLIESVEIHDLNRVVRVTVPSDDGLPDFLVNDVEDDLNLPDMIYSSDGLLIPVTAVTDAQVTGTVGPGNAEIDVQATMPNGWVYLRCPEPSAGEFQIERVLREDGSEIMVGSNAWTTHRVKREEGQDPVREDFLHIVDNQGSGNYTVVYGNIPTPTPTYTPRVTLAPAEGPPTYTPTSTPVPPTPTFTPSPTLTPTNTPAPVATPTPGEFEGETITIPLDLPEGAKPLEMVLIPAGTFMMGSPEDEGSSDERPQHEVTISQDFYLGMYEVTQAQWEAVMGSNPSHFGGKPNNPVECVSWNDCQDFIDNLNDMGLISGEFRLPTEAEWEYACRAGTTTRFYWGDDPNDTEIDDYAWYSGNSGSKTHEVGQKFPNDWGLHDMSGNVWEWCQDWYGGYPSGPIVDPTSQQSGSDRVLRGGSWGYDAGYCRSASRTWGRPSLTNYLIGFRLVLSRTPSSEPTPTESPVPPTPTFTPSPTPTPTNTPAPVATATPGDVTGETITIPLDLPEGAKPLEMVLIPAGTFTMGSPEDERGRYSDEGPQHEVTISQDFYLGKYEVTQAQWEAVIGSNPSSFDGKPNNPVENVSWNDCQDFIENLNDMGLISGEFRLPTEAEWEYACRAGTTTRFYWGDDPNDTEIDDYAWYRGNNSPSGTKEVGQKLPNAWGLYDMSGNVWEWCQDWYGAYPSGPIVDPTGQQSGSYRVVRGGYWSGYLRDCRSAFRDYYSPGSRSADFGVRLLRSSP